MVTEGVVLCLLGGTAALVLARWGADLVRGVILPDVYWHSSPIEGRVLAFTALTAVVAGLVSAIVPALQASRPELTGALKEGGWGVSARRSRTRCVLTVAQGAFSVVLLVGAGLLVRSLSQVRSLDLGMDVDHLAQVILELDAAEPTPEESIARYREAAERLRRLPGVIEVGLTDLPFGWTWGLAISVPGLDSIPWIPGGGPYHEYVNPAYLRTMGIELLAGRGLEETDGAGSSRVMVVNETMARTLWPKESALGQCVIVGEAVEVEGGECTTVVGIVENATRRSLTYEPFMKYYMPMAQASYDRFRFPRAIYVRTEGDPARLTGGIRQEAMAAGSDIRYVEVRGLREILDPQARSWTLGATMFSAFGVLALVVAAAGLYSLLAYQVARRTRELGVRTALGASRVGVVRLIFKDGVRLAVAGVVLGLAISWAAGRYVESVLFRVSPRDPLVFGSVAVTLLVVSLVASGFPAWRASRIDAMQALRTE
jgi:predicted permease